MDTKSTGGKALCFFMAFYRFMNIYNELYLVQNKVEKFVESPSGIRAKCMWYGWGGRRGRGGNIGVVNLYVYTRTF